MNIGENVRLEIIALSDDFVDPDILDKDVDVVDGDEPITVDDELDFTLAVIR